MESDASPIKDNWSFAIVPDDGMTGPMVLTRTCKREKSVAPKPAICNSLLQGGQILKSWAQAPDNLNTCNGSWRDFPQVWDSVLECLCKQKACKFCAFKQGICTGSEGFSGKGVQQVPRQFWGKQKLNFHFSSLFFLNSSAELVNH